jgi:hypothetical protein
MHCVVYQPTSLRHGSGHWELPVGGTSAD